MKFSHIFCLIVGGVIASETSEQVDCSIHQNGQVRCSQLEQIEEDSTQLQGNTSFYQTVLTFTLTAQILFCIGAICWTRRRVYNMQRQIVRQQAHYYEFLFNFYQEFKRDPELEWWREQQQVTQDAKASQQPQAPTWLKSTK